MTGNPINCYIFKDKKRYTHNFKSLVPTIPPRGQEPDFYTCRYFKFQPPNSVTFTSTGRFIIKSAARAHASYLKEPQFILEPNSATCYG